MPMSRSCRAALVLVLAAVPVVVRAQTNPALFQDMRWRNIGPFRGGRAVAVAGVASDPLTYYFGGVGSGVWKTADAGGSWRNVSDSTFGTASVGAIAVAPSDPNVVYVGMGEHAVRGVMTSHGDGMYRSTDAGRAWTHLGLRDTRAISRIHVHPGDPDRVYVAAQGAPYGPSEERGIYRSTDGGVTWAKLLYVNATAGASDLSMDPGNPRILYAAFWDHLRRPWEVRSGGPGSGIWKSTDGGDTWVKLEQGFPSPIGKTSVSVAANSDRVYALVEADPQGGLYRSEDGGASWKLINESWDIRHRAWYYIEVYADPRNADVVWVLGAPAMKSVDGGRTFHTVAVPHGDNHDLWINPTDSDYLINANDGGANVSLNGGASWSTQENQPTAQFYRVNVDNRFPYYVYGGQQDNTSVGIASAAPGGIGWKDWYPVAGCESAYIAFDPDAPGVNYGGCYMGQIEAWDSRTGTGRNVMAYPQLPAAMAAREMTYRFNWNAPILVSRHDPRVLYHAGNVLLASRDGGHSWTEISPDLTRDDDAKQGYGGGPITNEGAGGEIYNTIMYVAESPRDPQVLWVGSDDGLVHVTRDGGATWIDVTPRNLAEGMVNAIDASPHDPAAAYVAYTRYKFNDFTPHVYKTADYGRTWRRVVEGIAPEAHVRVVREDPKRRGLLYAGTELGAYVSWDDGAHWQSLQLNLPITPITDLIVHPVHNDLVAATQGRSFWILDDLSPLQQADRAIESAELHVFSPRPAYRVAGGLGGGFGGGTNVGANPPNGAVIDVYLAAMADSAPVTLEILDAADQVLRRYSSSRDSDSLDVLRLKAGHNRLTWNLQLERVDNVSGQYVFGTLQGRRVVPGRYTARVRRADTERSVALEVRADPRVSADAAGFQAQADFLDALDAELSAMHRGVVELRGVRDQVRGLTARAGELTGGAELAAAGDSLVVKIEILEDSLVQKRTVDGQTVINFPARLDFHYTYLRSSLLFEEGGVTEGARRLYQDLTAQWTRHRSILSRLLGVELDGFNELVRAHGIPAIITSAPAPQPIP